MKHLCLAYNGRPSFKIQRLTVRVKLFTHDLDIYMTAYIPEHLKLQKELEMTSTLPLGVTSNNESLKTVGCKC
jgi:hypothetical protein